MEEIKFRLEQSKILNYTEGLMAVPSVPGAGKTFILTHLANKLINENLEDERKILILSYMNSAAENIRTRIESLLENNEEVKFKVMTIHKFASTIIKNYSEKVNVLSDYSIASDKDSAILLSSAVSEWKNSKAEDFEFFIDKDRFTFINSILGRWQKAFTRLASMLISSLKTYGISPEYILNELKDSKNPSLLKSVSEVYKIYSKKMKNKALIDYDDLLYLSYDCLKKNKNLLKELKYEFQYIFEDEAQDSNVLQEKILKLISNGNLVKFGDANQSIMGTFTNSSPKLFIKFTNSAKNKQEIFRAGRSSQEIINFVNKFSKSIVENHPVDECKNALVYQEIKAVREGEFPENPKQKNAIRVFEFSKDNEEMKHIVKSIKKFQNKYKDKTMAVLLPANYLIDNLAKLLEKEEIEYDILSDIPKEKLKVLIMLGDILNYISSPSDNILLIELLKKYFITKKFEGDGEFWYALEHYAIEKIIFPTGENIDFYTIPEVLKGNIIWGKFLLELNKIKNILSFPQNSLEKLLIFISEELNLSIEDKAMLENIAFELKTLFRLNPKWTIRDFANELKDSRKNRFAFFAKFIYGDSGYQASTDKVTLTSYHKSKGLEWDFVYLSFVSSKNFPAFLEDKFRAEEYYLKYDYSNPLAIAKAELEGIISSNKRLNPLLQARIEKINESIRLIYVGLSRAREFLFVSGSNNENVSYYLHLMKDILKGGLL